MHIARISTASLRLLLRAFFCFLGMKTQINKKNLLIWLKFRLFFRGGLNERAKTGEAL